MKDPTEFTGPESYVHQMVKVRLLSTFSFQEVHSIYFRSVIVLLTIYILVDENAFLVTEPAVFELLGIICVQAEKPTSYFSIILR